MGSLTVVMFYIGMAFFGNAEYTDMAITYNPASMFARVPEARVEVAMPTYSGDATTVMDFQTNGSLRITAALNDPEIVIADRYYENARFWD